MPSDHQSLHKLRTIQWRRICQRKLTPFCDHALALVHALGTTPEPGAPIH
jgi:hypothetical protein